MDQDSYREAVNYPPWIGDDYGQKRGKRILLIGRSYYDAHYENHTIPDYINVLIKTEKEDLFFHAAEQILSEKQHWKTTSRKFPNAPPSLNRKRFWNSIAFYQYLQGILEESYIPPTRKMWKGAQEPFKRIIQTLEPEIVAVFSREVFDHIPTMGGKNGPEFSSQGEVMRTWDVSIGDKTVCLCRMMHPRHDDFQLATWKILYNQFLEDHAARFEKEYFNL